MTGRNGILFGASWIALLVIGVTILLFGLIVTVLPDSDAETRAAGVASIGMGLFGATIAAIAFRRGARWAWWCLWYYPLFWAAHLVGNLPPGQDHVHQVVFIVVSVGALLATAPAFFKRSA